MAWTLEILGADPPAGQAGSLGLPDGERLAGQGIGEGQRERHKSILVPAGEAGGVIHRSTALWREGEL